jgi:hypothetical protein
MITLLLMPLLLSLLDRIALDSACAVTTHNTPRCGSALLRNADHTTLMLLINNNTLHTDRHSHVTSLRCCHVL